MSWTKIVSYSEGFIDLSRCQIYCILLNYLVQVAQKPKIKKLFPIENICSKCAFVTDMEIDLKSLKYLARALKSPKITRLCLNGNILTCCDAAMQLAVLLKSSQITKLVVVLIGFKLTLSAGTRFLIDGLKDTKIEMFKLIGDEIGMDEANYFNAMVLSNSRIKTLSFVVDFAGKNCLVKQTSGTEGPIFTISNYDSMNFEEAEYFRSFRIIGIKKLILKNWENFTDNVKYLEHAFDNVRIDHLIFDNTIISNSNDCVVAFKNTLIHKLTYKTCDVKKTFDCIYPYNARRVECSEIEILSEFLKAVKVTELKLSVDCASNQNMIALKSLLINCDARNVDLTNSLISDNGGFYLSKVLPQTSISHINLNHCGIKGAGAICLVRCLKNTQIISIELGRNLISVDDANLMNQIIYDSPQLGRIAFSVYFNGSKIINQISNNNETSIVLHFVNSSVGQYLNTFQTMGVSELSFSSSFTNLSVTDSQILAEALANVNIQNLIICNKNIFCKNLLNAFEHVKVAKLTVSPSNFYLDNSDIKTIAAAVKTIKVKELCLRSCRFAKFINFKCFASQLISNGIMYADFSNTILGSEGAKCLSEMLPRSNIVSINLSHCQIGDKGARYLARGLRHSQIIFASLEGNVISDNISKSITNQLAQTRDNARKICDAFCELVFLDLDDMKFKFSVPKKSKLFSCIDASEYGYLISVLRSNIFHQKIILQIFHMMCYSDFFDLNIMNKLQKFILAAQDEFIALIANQMLELIKYFGTNYQQYVKLIKYFENLKMSTVVENLLFHRILFYVDENEEFLHPYIYKLLIKYNMPLYHGKMDKEKIICFFHNHRGMEGALEFVKLLEEN